jgi:hypothetical protein
MGPAPYFLVHETTYSTTAVLEPWMGPDLYFFSSMRTTVRLLWYSNTGWAMLPIFSRPWDNLIDYWGTQFPDGTNSLFLLDQWDLNFGRDMLPISQEESLRPWGDNNHDPQTGPDSYIQRRLIPLVCKTTNYPTTPVLNLRIKNAPYLAKGSLHPWDNNW